MKAVTKAVIELGGEWPDKTGEENHLYRFYSVSLVSGIYSTTPSTPEYVCCFDDFQKERERLHKIWFSSKSRVPYFAKWLANYK